MDWKIADAALCYIVWSISRLRMSMKADVKKSCYYSFVVGENGAKTMDRQTHWRKEE